jgi:hypothetical protein
VREPSAIRPEIAHACGVLRELHELREGGRISGEDWLANVVAVIARVSACLAPSLEDRAALTAAARPRVTDAAYKRASENVGRFANSYSVNRPSVKGHTE